MTSSPSTSFPATPTCPSCAGRMIISMISPLTDETDRHVADDITYLCPKCGAEIEREVPVDR